MDDENEEDHVCGAFNQLFHTIKELQKIEMCTRHQNNTTLEICKREIESLIGEEVGCTDC